MGDDAAAASLTWTLSIPQISLGSDAMQFCTEFLMQTFFLKAYDSALGF